MRATFQNIKPGDRINFRNRDGTLRAARVNPLLIFDTHVVANYGNNGTVIDARNYLSHRTPKVRRTVTTDRLSDWLAAGHGHIDISGVYRPFP